MGAFCRTNHSEAKHAGSVFIYAGAPLPEGKQQLGFGGAARLRRPGPLYVMGMMKFILH